MKTKELLDRLEIVCLDNNLLADRRKPMYQYVLFKLTKNISNAPFLKSIRKLNFMEKFDEQN